MDGWTRDDVAMPRIEAIEASQRTFLQRVFGWMGGGLAITAAVAFWVAQPAVFESLVAKGGKGLFIGLLIAQLVLVFAISASISKMKAGLATVLFLVYSALMGVTIGPLLYVYTQASVFAAFAACSLTFAACAVYGYVTKVDLTKFGGIMMMLLIGVVIATVVNFFVKSAGFDRILTYIAIFVFVGLTAWDVQKLKAYHRNGIEGEQADKSMAIGGALMLYLDFINLFLLLLKVLGRRRE